MFSTVVFSTSIYGIVQTSFRPLKINCVVVGYLKYYLFALFSVSIEKLVAVPKKFVEINLHSYKGVSYKKFSSFFAYNLLIKLGKKRLGLYCLCYVNKSGAHISATFNTRCWA